APRVRMLLKPVADREIAELGCVAVPRDRVAPGPVAGRRGADVERHMDHVAGIEARAADLRELPPRSQVARAPLWIGLEASAGEDDASCVHIERFSGPFDAHAFHALV